jgi:hypothetical protein
MRFRPTERCRFFSWNCQRCCGDIVEMFRAPVLRRFGKLANFLLTATRKKNQSANCRSSTRPTNSPPLRLAAIIARTSALTTVSSTPAAPTAASTAA